MSDRESDVDNALSGHFTGPVVQAGAVHGDVHFHTTEASSPVPRQLMAPPPGFTDRSAELSILDTLLERPGVVVIRGRGGMGKTALALRWLGLTAARFPDGHLHAELSLPNGGPVAPEDVLGRFLRSFGIPHDRVPTGLPERIALYRSVTAEKLVALLLDDAVSAAQVRVLVPASSGSVTVVTSHRPLLGLLASGARAVAVGPLDSAAALDALGHHIGHDRVAAERESAERLADFCGGLPIALSVVGANAAARPKRPLARLVAELADERARLDGLSVEGDISVRSTLDMAYLDLPPELQRAYRLLGLHPGRIMETAAVAAMLATKPDLARRWLGALVDASLVEELDDDRYSLHDLVRVHAFEQALAEDDDKARTDSVRRVVCWYVFATQAANRRVMPARATLAFSPDTSFVLPDDLSVQVHALEWLERHRPTLLTAMTDALDRGWSELAYHLADALQPIIILHGHPADGLKTAETGLLAAEATGDLVGQIRMRKRLARVQAAAGDLERAQQNTDELLRSARASNDRRGEASAWKTRALIDVGRGNLTDAADALSRAVDILRSLGRRRGEGLALINLGETLTRLGQSDRAIGHLRRARELLTTLGVPDPYNDARAALALGQAYLDEGDTNSARSLFDHALIVFAEHGSDHQRGLTHQALARLAARIGDEEQSRRHSDRARTLLVRPNWFES
ncbi:tetratricopeptide repeat protein [Amycolatopsis pigmentata]|uniref:Tetratricopeptide repeat protein n=1 Tax=Amycolatopsis pigmentata TaxID=450801 RepID=A0ABW5G4B5_9PSEU